MKAQVDKIKKTLATEGVSAKVTEQLKDLREYVKANLNEPGYVKMIRMAYENIEENGDYTFLFLKDDNGKANLDYLLDLFADYTNKYNREELQDVRNLMEGIEPEDEEEEVGGEA
jgi:C4-type Zn-finger protein